MNWRQYLKLRCIIGSAITYLLREEKCKKYGHTPILQALATVIKYTQKARLTNTHSMHGYQMYAQGLSTAG